MRNLLFLVLVIFSSACFGEGTFIKQGALVEGTTRSVTNGGTMVLTVTSQTIQEFTGTLTQSVSLPNATLMPVGRRFLFINSSSAVITVLDSLGGTIANLAAPSSLSVYLVDASTAAGTWEITGSNSFTELDPLSLHLNGNNSPTGNVNWGGKNLTNIGNFSASTVTLPSEPISRALFLDSSNIVRGSPTTAAELANVSGLTSPVQTQLNNKANLNLSNLASPTAINQSLLFGAGFDLGSFSGGKPNVWVNNKLSVGAVTNYGGTFHIAQKPHFTMVDTNGSNSITNVDGGLTTTVNITSANPNVLAQVSVGDIIAISSAPTVFGVVTQVVDNSHFVVSPGLGSGQIAQTIVVFPAIFNVEDAFGTSVMVLNETNTTPLLTLNGNQQNTGNFSVSGTTLLSGSTTLGSLLVQKGSTSGTVSFQAPATVSSYSVKWPAAQGANNTTLINDGSGNLSWQAGGGGGGANTTLSNLVSPTAVNQTLNMTSGTFIGDNGQRNIIDTNSKLLMENSGLATVSWASYELIDGNGTGLDWRARNLFDDTGNLSVDWNQRQLLSATTTDTVLDFTTNAKMPNVNNGPALQIGPIPGDVNLQASISTDSAFDGPTVLLIQGLGANSNNYNGIYIGNDAGEVGLNIFLNGSGRSSDGGANNATIRMENGGTLRVKAVGGLTLEGAVSFPDSINDDSNNISLNPNTRQAFDDGSNVTLDWQNRIAYDNNSDASINWQTKLLQVGGSTKYNWDTGIFRDAGTNKTADVESRQVYDVNGDLVADWSGPLAFRADNLQQNGATSGHINFTVPTTITTYSVTWPSAQGGASTVLTNDGSGNLSWAAATGGVTGPGSSTANGIARWSGTGGTALLSSTATMDASGNQVGTTVSTSGNVTAGTGGQSVVIGSAGGGFSGIGIGTPSAIQFDGNGTGIKTTQALTFLGNSVSWNDGTGNLGISGNGLHNYGRPITIASFTNFDLGGTSSSGVLTPVLREETPQAAVVTTTNATQTTFTTIALTNNTVYQYRAECAARRTDAADRGLFVRTVAVYREAAGVATLQGPVQNDFSQSSDNTWDVTWTVSSNNLLLSVTGASGKTVNWQCNLRSTRVQ